MPIPIPARIAAPIRGRITGVVAEISSPAVRSRRPSARTSATSLTTNPV